MSRWWLCAALGLAGCSRSFTAPQAARDAGVGPIQAVALQTTLAPKGHTGIAVSGGLPPYSFAITQRASGPDAVISDDGGYQAGALGSGVDVIQVSDQAAQHATVGITVGPALAIFPDAASVVPGGPVTFYATGGQPPYVFSMVRNGNPSWGSMQPSGSYTAGVNEDVVDTVQVVDSNQVRLTAQVSVGATRLTTSAPGAQLLRGDFNGDGVADLLVFVGGDIQVGIGGPGGPRITQVLRAGNAELMVGDFNGDGFDDVLVERGSSDSLLLGGPEGLLRDGPSFVIQLTAPGPVLGAPFLVPVRVAGVAQTLLAGVVSSSLVGGDTARFGVYGLADGGGLSLGPLGYTPFVELDSFDFPTSQLVSLPVVSSRRDAVLVQQFPDLPYLLVTGMELDGGALQVHSVVPQFTTPSFTAQVGALCDLNRDGVLDICALAYHDDGSPTQLFTVLGLPDAGFGGERIAVGDALFSFEAPPDLFSSSTRTFAVDDDGGLEVTPAADGGVALADAALPARAANLLSGDFNGDAINDLIESQVNGDIYFRPADGLGHFETGRLFQATPPPFPSGVFVPLAVGDLDGDGRADVISSNIGVSILTGTPEGKLSLDAQFFPGDDLLADAITPDGAFMVTQSADRRVSIDHLSSDRDGGWSAVSQTFPIPVLPDSITLLSSGGAFPMGDVLLHLPGQRNLPYVIARDDGDGGVDAVLLGSFGDGNLFPAAIGGGAIDDLVYQSANGAPIEIHLSNGGNPPTWSIAASSVLALGVGTSDLSLLGSFGSVPGGRPDTLLIGDYDLGVVYAYDVQTQTTTQLISQTVVPPPFISYAQLFSAGDFNGDGRTDILWQDVPVPPNYVSRLRVALRTDVDFQVVDTNIAVRSDTFSFAAGDVNGDGRTDLAILNQDDSGLAIYLSQVAADGTVTFH